MDNGYIVRFIRKERMMILDCTEESKLLIVNPSVFLILFLIFKTRIVRYELTDRHLQ